MKQKIILHKDRYGAEMVEPFLEGKIDNSEDYFISEGLLISPRIAERNNDRLEDSSVIRKPSFYIDAIMELKTHGIECDSSFNNPALIIAQIIQQLGEIIRNKGIFEFNTNKELDYSKSRTNTNTTIMSPQGIIDYIEQTKLLPSKNVFNEFINESFMERYQKLIQPFQYSNNKKSSCTIWNYLQELKFSKDSNLKIMNLAKSNISILKFTDSFAFYFDAVKIFEGLKVGASLDVSIMMPDFFIDYFKYFAIRPLDSELIKKRNSAKIGTKIIKGGKEGAKITNSLKGINYDKLRLEVIKFVSEHKDDSNKSIDWAANELNMRPGFPSTKTLKKKFKSELEPMRTNKKIKVNRKKTKKC